ncbi:MAG: patatin-like phospholipase family protein [Bacteroidia bacterium]|nr:patatin-like phospholipase family protein [Bacteroidia bacterium]
MFDWHTLTIGSLGFLKMSSIEKVLHEYLPQQFSSLSIPLYVCATDIINNQTVFFSEGDLIPALLASSSIPVIYEPVKYKGTYLVDGGVINNLPVEILRNKCDKIIAVHVNHLSNEKKEISFKDIIEKSFHLSINHSVYSKLNAIDIFIDPPNMSKFSMFDTKNAPHIFEYAYDYTCQMKNMILSNLNL